MKQKLLILICAIMATVSAHAYDFVYQNEDVKLYCTIKDNNTCEIENGQPKHDILVIPEVVEFDGNAFTVTSIGVEAFIYKGNGITQLVLPNSLTRIGSGAFIGFEEITSLTLPNSLLSIGYRAFAQCSSLISVTLPESLETIGNAAFEGDYNLNAFYGKFASEDNRCLIVNGVLNAFAPAGLQEYEIPSIVTSIGERAFYKFNKLRYVRIPVTVTAIGSSAFYGCASLKMIKVENDNPANISLGDIVFFGLNYKDCVLYVPEGSENLYANAPQWEQFYNIQGYPTSGVEAIGVDAECGDAYYDLSGRKVANPANGIFVQDGKKVYIK